MNEDIFTNKISFVYADDDILVVRKFAGLPSAPLKESETENALYYVSQKYPEVLKVKNSYKEIEGGLLHRIDTDTEGLLLFALNDFAWQNLYNQQKQNQFVKEYTAFCVKDFSNLEILKGFPEFPCLLQFPSLDLGKRVQSCLHVCAEAARKDQHHPAQCVHSQWDKHLQSCSEVCFCLHHFLQ